MNDYFCPYPGCHYTSNDETPHRHGLARLTMRKYIAVTLPKYCISIFEKAQINNTESIEEI